MGKRSDFPRRPQDDYATPPAAIQPLLPFLNKDVLLVDPCPGEGLLAKHLLAADFKAAVADDGEDARSYKYPIYMPFAFVTNPPWRRDVLHPIIVNLSDQAPTWLLLDADWVHCKQAIPYLGRLRVIVSVGRVKWIENSPHVGKDNAAWHRFGPDRPGSLIRFYGRQA